jgi:uncharacterized protein YbjT (DUF2867 family)
MILVTGSTGKVGTELVRVLREQNVDFQALAHSPASIEKMKQQGIHSRHGSFDEPESMRSALEGNDKLFLLSPALPRQAELEQSIIDMAKASGISYIVKLSVYDAGKRIAAYKTHGVIEDHLKASGIGYTILRPNYFMQNFVTIDAPTVIYQSALFAPTGSARISYVDVRDIADVAALALTSSDHVNQVYEITGAEAYSYAEVAAMLSQSLGKTIQHIDLPSEAFREAMIHNGVPEWYADLLQELYADYQAGYGARISPDVQRVTGHAPRTLQAFFNEHVTTFR